MRSLIWKEWHEHGWKLGFSSIVFGALAAIGTHARITDDDSLMFSICMLGIVLIPMIASIALVPGERSENTLESLVALPVSPRKILTVKMIMGVLICVVPMLAAAVLSLLMANGREITSGEMAWSYFRTTLTMLALFFWMFALTVHLPTETRSGLLGMGILLSWMMLAFGFSMEKGTHWPLILTPFVFFFGSGSDDYLMRQLSIARLLAALLVQGVICAVLIVWANWRFARMEDRS